MTTTWERHYRIVGQLASLFQWHRTGKRRAYTSLEHGQSWCRCCSCTRKLLEREEPWRSETITNNESQLAIGTHTQQRSAGRLLTSFSAPACSVKPKFHSARHVTSRHDTTPTRSTCRARRDERVEPCCSTSSTQPKCMSSTRRTCRVVSRRDVMSQVEFGLFGFSW